MAATKTSLNDTPDTPNVSESKIARMKVDELRRERRSLVTTDHEVIRRWAQGPSAVPATGNPDE